MIVPIPAALMATVVISSFALYHDGTRGSAELPILAENMSFYHGTNLAIARAQADEKLTGKNGKPTSNGYYKHGREVASGSMPIFTNMGNWQTVMVEFSDDELAVITWPGVADIKDAPKTGVSVGSIMDEVIKGNKDAEKHAKKNEKEAEKSGTTTEADYSGSNGSGKSESVSTAFSEKSYENTAERILAGLADTPGDHFVGFVQSDGKKKDFVIAGQHFEMNGKEIPEGAPAILTIIPKR